MSLTARTGANDNAGYVFETSSSTYTEITGGVISSANGDDGAETISLPFPFTFDSLIYNNARINVNGWIALGKNYQSDGYFNDLANPEARPLLAPFWDDLYDDSTSEIRFETLGSSPERVFVVQWKGVRWAGSTGNRQNFQVRLYEADNRIEYVFGAMANSSNTSASIGIVDPQGGSGHFLSVTPGAPPQTSTTTADNNITSINNLPSGTIYRFVPPCFHLWLGTVDTNWHNPDNWNCGVVPDGDDNVSILSGGSFDAQVTSDAAAGIVGIMDGAGVTLDGGNFQAVGFRIFGNLIVTGNESIAISGTTASWDCDPSIGIFDSGSGVVTLTGSGTTTLTAPETFFDLILINGKSFDPGPSALHVQGTFTNQGTFWPSTDISEGNIFLGDVLNEGVWRQRISKQLFSQSLTNTTTGTFNASSDSVNGVRIMGDVQNQGTFNASAGGWLEIHGNWVQDGTFNHNNGKAVFSGNGLQEIQSSSGSTSFYDLSIRNGSNAYLNNNTRILNRLDIDQDASLDINTQELSVNGELANEGIIAQVRNAPAGILTPFLHIQNESGTADAYFGMEITPTQNLGNTRVEITHAGAAGCTSNPADELISRCYSISPQTPAEAAIRFYFENSELNNQVFDAMKIWHPAPTWQQAGFNYSYSASCTSGQIDCWMQADGLENFSPFVLGSGSSPTFVGFQRISARSYDPVHSLILIMLLCLSVISCIGLMVFWTKKANTH